jgi:hypothetical protein
VAVASADGYTAEARDGQVIAARVAATTFLRSFQPEPVRLLLAGSFRPPPMVGLEDLSNEPCPMSASPPRASGSIEGYPTFRPEGPPEASRRPRASKCFPPADV